MYVYAISLAGLSVLSAISLAWFGPGGPGLRRWKRDRVSEPPDLEGGHVCTAREITLLLFLLDVPPGGTPVGMERAAQAAAGLRARLSEKECQVGTPALTVDAWLQRL